MMKVAILCGLLGVYHLVAASAIPVTPWDLWGLPDVDKRSPAAQNSPSSPSTCTGDDWRSTPDNFKKLQVDQWLKNWWTCHNTTDTSCATGNITKRETVDSLTERDVRSMAWDLKVEFAPTIDHFDCNENEQCSVGNCDDINQTLPDAKQGYFALSSIANFNDYMRHFYTAVDVSQMDQNSVNPVFLQTFSESGNPPSSGNEVMMEVLNAVLIAVGLILIGFMPELAGVAGALVPAITAAVKGAESGLSTASKTGGVLTGITGAVGNTLTKPNTLDIKELANLGQWTKTISDSMRYAIASADHSLIGGSPDDGGAYIWDYISDGSFASQAPDSTGDMTKFLINQFAAGAINAVYKFDRTYMLGLPKEGRDCNTILDQTVTDQNLKNVYFCDGADDWYYLTYRIPSDDAGFQYPRPQIPLGNDQLGKYGFTMQDIMNSSLAAYRVDPTMNYTTVRADRWTSEINNFKTQSTFEGMFTLPTCRMGGAAGHGPPAVGKRVDMYYPCQCDGLRALEDKHQATDAFKAASPLGQFDKYNKWCGGDNTAQNAVDG